MSAVGSDLRLARQLLHGSDRREWWRITLTAAGSALATGFASAAVVLASVRDGYAVSLFHGLVSQSGTRSGVIAGLLLLLVPVLAFLGQCTRIGAVHRDRRLAALRLAGATPWQVRRIAALETGLACSLGSAVATVFSVLVVVRVWSGPTAVTWAGIALAAVGVPVLGAVAGALALRRVVASPLGWVRRVGPGTGRGPGMLFLGGLVLLAGVAPLVMDSGRRAGNRFDWQTPLTVFALVVALGAGAVWLAGSTARITGRLLAERARTATTLLAAARLRDDPWAPARIHAAVLVVTVAGTAFLCVRHAMLDELRIEEEHLGADMAYYTTGLDLTGAALLVALAITLSGLAVGTAESLTTRRRALAVQVAAGVPRPVLNRALLLETALPLAPALLLAGGGGLAIGVWYSSLRGDGSIPWTALLVAPAVYTTCLLAAATALPLLGRSVRPGELRYV
ncbi:FtsX-like permease family protein [Streptomyces lancefieldiae]|uniref:FtsX-like permease family protein n=1 Tax=Streptomyces lancefieldiae TaxID=3075520 RepID=A0ABU3AVD6_9ACTN|nr:FtsX-like permease family protein [Streptomyces sp. DSM 40712]MDT0612781.1 FtsX-like permease family protein [Streptomyces sp. DSM 40712]